MQVRNAAECGPASESSPLADHSARDRCTRELDWKSPPSLKLPQPSFRWDERRRKRKPRAVRNTFEAQGTGWWIKSIQDLPAGFAAGPGLPSLSSDRVWSPHAGMTSVTPEASRIARPPFCATIGQGG
jgi:hypothetical protein